MLLRPFLTSHPLARASHRRSPRQASTTHPLWANTKWLLKTTHRTPPRRLPRPRHCRRPCRPRRQLRRLLNPLWYLLGAPSLPHCLPLAHQRCRPTIPACLIRCGRRVEVRPLLLSISRSGIVSPLSIFPSPPIHVSLSILFHSHLSCSDRVVFVKRRKGKSIGSHKEYGMPHRQSPLEFPLLLCEVRQRRQPRGQGGDNAARRRWVARQWPKDGARVT